MLLQFCMLCNYLRQSTNNSWKIKLSSLFTSRLVKWFMWWHGLIWNYSRMTDWLWNKERRQEYYNNKFNNGWTLWALQFIWRWWRWRQKGCLLLLNSKGGGSSQRSTEEERVLFLSLLTCLLSIKLNCK